MAHLINFNEKSILFIAIKFDLKEFVNEYWVDLANKIHFLFVNRCSIQLMAQIYYYSYDWKIKTIIKQMWWFVQQLVDSDIENYLNANDFDYNDIHQHAETIHVLSFQERYDFEKDAVVIHLQLLIHAVDVNHIY